MDYRHAIGHIGTHMLGGHRHIRTKEVAPIEEDLLHGLPLGGYPAALAHLQTRELREKIAQRALIASELRLYIVLHRVA